MESSSFQVGAYLQSVARERWLSAEEVFIILCGHPNIDLALTQFRQSFPFDGELTLFGDGDSVKNDGVTYSRKGGNSKDRERETYQDVKVNGAVLIKGRYSRTDPPVADNAGDAATPRPVPKCLKRRIYKLADPAHPSSSLNLVHYRECPEKEPVEKHSLHPSVFEQFNHFYARYLKYQADAAEQKNRTQQVPKVPFVQIKSEIAPQGSPPGSYPAFYNNQNQAQSQPQNQNQSQSMPSGHHHPGSYQAQMAASSSSSQLGPASGYASNAHSSSSGTVSNYPGCAVLAKANSNLGDDLDLLDSDIMDELLNFASDNQQPYPQQGQWQGQGQGAVQAEMPDRSDMMMMVDTDETQSSHVPPPPAPLPLGLSMPSLACRSYDSYSSPHRDSLNRESFGSFNAASTANTNAKASPQTTSPKRMASQSISHGSGIPVPAPVLVHKFQVVISDFSPTQDHQRGGGTKVLICLDNEIPTALLKANINVCFGDFRARYFVSARAEAVGSTALRCKTPANAQSGSCQLWIEDEQGLLTSEPAEQLFEFITPVAIDSVGASRLGKRPAFRGSLPNTAAPSENAAAASGSYHYRLPPHFAHSSLRRASPLRGAEGSGDFDKEHKIRIVEKLGTMKYALAHDDALSSSGHSSHSAHSESSGGMHITTGGALLPHNMPRNSPRLHSVNSFSLGDSSTGEAPVKWLDDQELSQLSPEELEVLMDRYIMVVVKQLVQLAALDDDLKAEIDSLDSSGFSLLHYCCLYNLNSLIPVLLARGADVNRRTSTGSTALHLAAGAGHFAVAMALVDSGAQVDSLDANNVLPSDAAYEAGFTDIYNELLSRENRMVHTTTSTSSAAEVTTAMQDANNALIANNRAIYGNNHSGPMTPHSALSHVAKSPVATSKSATDIPTLKFDSPPPAFPSYMDDSSGANNEGGSSALSNKLLHEAFASLSLTDKCALSLSMSQQKNPDSSTAPGSNKGSATNTPRTSKINLSINLSALEGGLASLNNSTGSAGGGLNSSVNVDEISEMQSVLSETDKESLDVAMSMMGHFELRQVEDEVRTIQNNVRGWILRKNYTNLREAARVLQVAWREKRRVSVPHGLFHPGHDRTDSPTSQTEDKSPSSALRDSVDSTGAPAYARSGAMDVVTSTTGAGFVLQDPNPTQLMAAATLQAATRAMLARRRSFSSVRKQTMASLVIQKSLVKWWEHNKVGAQGSVLSTAARLSAPGAHGTG